MTSASTSSTARTVPERGSPSTAESSPSSSPGPGNARMTSRPSFIIAAFTWPSRRTTTAPASSPWWNRTSPRRYRRMVPSCRRWSRSVGSSSLRNPSATAWLPLWRRDGLGLAFRLGVVELRPAARAEGVVHGDDLPTRRAVAVGLVVLDPVEDRRDHPDERGDAREDEPEQERAALQAPDDAAREGEAHADDHKRHGGACRALRTACVQPRRRPRSPPRPPRRTPRSR